MHHSNLRILVVICIFFNSLSGNAQNNKTFSDRSAVVLSKVLSQKEWDDIRDSMDRGLEYLATQQRKNGSFPTFPTGNPAITSLCVLAFLSQGHLPDDSSYGKQIDLAVDFVLSCQLESGLITRVRPRGDDIDPNRNPSHTAIYNHTIAGTMLAEVYGMADAQRSEEIRLALERAIKFSLDEQIKPKRLEDDYGGWRYVRPYLKEKSDSDASHTSWQLTFLRAAKNAGFDVPTRRIELAVDFLKTRHIPDKGGFINAAFNRQKLPLHTTNGAGILGLAMGGLHNSDVAKDSAKWLLQRPFRPYHNPNIERYHYAAFLCSAAMLQLGGDQWEKFYPVMAKEMISGQLQDGSWRGFINAQGNEGRWGSSFTTSTAVLALAVPDQLIPVFQR